MAGQQWFDNSDNIKQEGNILTVLLVNYNN